ncbi:hypothetical protein CPLU01_07909 [Colletotrichum plurivorum]|uniref:Uncharacterized protein n=1 Tax=Colletotrichum plurivorum TaxID=2175906 RepID=A0A8H6NE27_9PEZI|nr:hypothetical protein CPLU01_07909 [Colletotrichum plurivorum]
MKWQEGTGAGLLPLLLDVLPSPYTFKAGTAREGRKGRARAAKWKEWGGGKASRTNTTKTRDFEQLPPLGPAHAVPCHGMPCHAGHGDIHFDALGYTIRMALPQFGDRPHCEALSTGVLPSIARIIGAFNGSVRHKVEIVNCVQPPGDLIFRLYPIGPVAVLHVPTGRLLEPRVVVDSPRYCPHLPAAARDNRREHTELRDQPSPYAYGTTPLTHKLPTRAHWRDLNGVPYDPHSAQSAWRLAGNEANNRTEVERFSLSSCCLGTYNIAGALSVNFNAAALRSIEMRQWTGKEGGMDDGRFGVVRPSALTVWSDLHPGPSLGLHQAPGISPGGLDAASPTTRMQCQIAPRSHKAIEETQDKTSKQNQQARANPFPSYRVPPSSTATSKNLKSALGDTVPGTWASWDGRMAGLCCSAADACKSMMVPCIVSTLDNASLQGVSGNAQVDSQNRMNASTALLPMAHKRLVTTATTTTTTTTTTTGRASGVRPTYHA